MGCSLGCNIYSIFLLPITHSTLDMQTHSEVYFKFLLICTASRLFQSRASNAIEFLDVIRFRVPIPVNCRNRGQFLNKNTRNLLCYWLLHIPYVLTQTLCFSTSFACSMGFLQNSCLFPYKTVTV